MRCRVLVTVLTIFAVWGINASVIASEPPFSHGLVQNSCAPWDGPAIDIRLTTEPVQCQRVNGSYLNIGVWRGLPIRSGQIVKFGATSDVGFASLCRKVGDCERAESGTLVFESYQDGSGASGHYELHFKGGKDMSAVFDAKWCESHSICR